MADVLIVGGGVIGCAIAYELSKGGASVTLLERGEIGGQASGAAAGMLVPRSEATGPGPFLDLALASERLFPPLAESLRRETGIDIELTRSGLLSLALSEDEEADLRRLLARQRGLGFFPQWLDGQDARALEPRLSQRVLAAVFSRDEYQVNPGHLAQALAAAAQGQGTRLCHGTSLQGFVGRGQRVAAVRTTDGDKIAADHIVLAAGPWTRPLARKLGFDVPTRPMRGQMLAYRAAPLRHIIWGDEGYLVPKPALSRAEGAGGFLYAGATVEDVGFRPSTSRRGLASLRRMARRLVPALRYGEVASAWAGLRPGSPDGLPILGPLPGWENVTVATGHFRNGILLAPITGKLLSQLILEGRTELPLEPFRVERFRR